MSALLDNLQLRLLTAADEPELLRVLELPEMRDFVLSEGTYSSPREFVDFYMTIVGHPDCANWGAFAQVDGKEVLVAVRDIYPCPEAMKHDEINEPSKVTGSWVNPEFRRKGVALAFGQRLLKQIFEAQPDLSWLQASCYEDNHAALSLVQKLGFRFYCTKPYNGKTDVCFLMHRDPDYDYGRLLALRPQAQKGMQGLEEPVR